VVVSLVTGIQDRQFISGSYIIVIPCIYPSPFHFSPVFNPETEGEFENKWHQALACIERDFPSSLQTFVFHLLHHLPTYVKHNFKIYIDIYKTVFNLFSVNANVILILM
jgi:hypothetical protein